MRKFFDFQYVLLKLHIAVYRCVTKQNLEMHLLTHCTEKLLECEDCEFRCRSAHGLDKHYQLVHGTVSELNQLTDRDRGTKQNFLAVRS